MPMRNIKRAKGGIDRLTIMYGRSDQVEQDASSCPGSSATGLSVSTAVCVSFFQPDYNPEV